MTDTETLMEKVRIYELCARYTLALDRHDIEGWTRCFAEDGVFGFGTRGIRGRDKINEYGNVHKTLASRHLSTSLVYDVHPSGDYASGQSTTVMTLATRRGYKIGFLGRYDDELRKIDGQWRFARRWVTADTLPTDPGFDVLAADPEIAELIQPLLDAYERLGEPE